MTEQQIKRLEEIRDELLKMFPTPCNSIDFVIQNYHTPPRVEIALHSTEDYKVCSEFMRAMGFGERNKQVVGTPPGLWTKIWVEPKPGMELRIWANGLSPSCRLEKVTKRIPKQQTVDTGDFIEVEETKIVCGNEHANEPQPASEAA